MLSSVKHPHAAIIIGMIILWSGIRSSAEVRLNSIKDASLQCDYLVITPEKFIRQAERLAAYRNSFNGDDVTCAGVIELSKIYDEFKTGDTMKTFDAIHQALLWAYRNWPHGYRYVVLIGDDSACTPAADTSQWSRGPMPSFTFRDINVKRTYDGDDVVDSTFDTIYTFSDSYYLVSSDTVTQYSDADSIPAALGRIPCETEQQCSLYIDRVIRMETHPERGPWMNSAIFIADDGYQGLRRDPLYSFHLASCEKISGRYLADYFTHKLYLAEFSRDVDMQHVLAGDDYFSSINRGALWTLYFGHGHETYLSDEIVIAGREAFRFRNRERRGVFCSFSCSNGTFNYPFRQSMCKQFLFADSGGYMIYIGATEDAYAFANEQLAANLFTARDSLPATSFGMQFHNAVILTGSTNAMIYSFLGDPALRLYAGSDSVSFAAGENDVSCKASGIGTGSSFSFRIVRCDSVAPIGDTSLRYVRYTTLDSGQGTVSSDSFVISRAAAAGSDARLIVYAWNDSSEARGMFPLPRSIGGQDINAPVRKFLAQKSVPNRYSVENNVVSLGVHPDEATVSVRGIDGRRMCSFTIPHGAHRMKLDRRGISPGIYLVEIRNDTRALRGVVKWMKTR